MHTTDNPMMSTEWSVNLSDDDTRNMRADEIAFEYLQGAIHPDDTFVWREGMDDWVPLGQCQELQEVIRQYSAAAAEPPATAHAPPDQQGYDNAPEDDDEGFGATVMMDVSAAQAESPFGNAVPNAPGGIAQTLASPMEQHEDPFAGVRPDADPQPAPSSSRRVGERNEASALFSIADITSAANARKPNAADAAPVERDPLADIMNLGGGSGLSGGIASAFAPPPIHAPAPPAPKPVAAPAPAAAVAPPIAAAQLSAPKKSKRGLIFGVAAGVLLLAGGAVGFVLMSSEQPTAQADASPDASAETAKDGDSATDDNAAEDDKDKETATAEDTANSKDDNDGKDAKDAKDAKDGNKVATTKTGTTATTTKDTKKTTVATDDKKEDDKDKEKTDEKGPFSVNAARSALAGAAGAASGCKKKGGPTGRGRVTVTFAPSGRATQATVGPPFAGTAVGSCAAAAFRGASVPPFDGGAQTVAKSFFIK